MDSSRSLALSTHTTRGVLGALPELPQPDGAHPGTGGNFCSLSQALRLLPGPQRLVRAVAEVEQAQNGNHGQRRSRPESVQRGPASHIENLLTQHSLKTAFDSILKELASNDSEPLRLIRNAVASELKGRGSAARVANPDADSVGAPCAIRRLGIRARIRARRDIAPLGCGMHLTLARQYQAPLTTSKCDPGPQKQRSAQLGCFALVLALPETRSTRCIRGGSRILATVRVCVVPPRRSWIWR